MAPSSARTSRLDIVICTYNRALALDRVLDRLRRQLPADGLDWGVLVVDNASTDATAAVVAAHRQRSDLPIRYVLEPQQGLTPARLRGARETDGEWIAYVDDDNLLQPGWVRAIGAAIQRHPTAGGFGGRVLLDWEHPPPASFSDFGFCFAEQDLGADARPVASLVGAGMVLRRAALAASGWTQHPLLADRVGRSLISGGDAEIALRVAATGAELWYAPEAVMRHRMPPTRGRRSYLFAINKSLGATEPLVDLLAWREDYASWRDKARKDAEGRMRQASLGLRWSVQHRRKLTAAVAWLHNARGFRAGVQAVETMPPARREELLGRAAPSRGEPATAPSDRRRLAG